MSDLSSKEFDGAVKGEEQVKTIFISPEKHNEMLSKLTSSGLSI